MRRKRPTVSLLNIQFFWEEASFENSGIPTTVSELGWTQEHRSNVAYSIADCQAAVQENRLLIRARFHKSEPNGRIQVRTTSIDVDPRDFISLKLHKRQPGKSALGEIPPSTVFFNKTSYSVYRGKHTLVPLKVHNAQFPKLGVGIYDINWRWEFRELDEEKTKEEGKDVWKEDWHTIRVSDRKLPRVIASKFEMTKHRVYALLDLPKTPWTPYQLPDISNGFPIQLPVWSSILDIACVWAEGATTKEEAARMITNRLFADGKFVYNTNSSYMRKANPNKLENLLRWKSEGEVKAFFLSKVLERIQGGYGFGEKANCLDCALMVASMANALGCDLKVGKFQNQPDIDATDSDHYLDNRFEINPIKAIGKEDAKETMAGLKVEDGHFFTYHTVAWMSPGQANSSPEDFERPENLIFDACVQFLVDGNADEESYAPAAGLPMAEGEESYVNRLAKNSEMGRPRCKPQPITVLNIQLS